MSLEDLKEELADRKLALAQAMREEDPDEDIPMLRAAVASAEAAIEKARGKAAGGATASAKPDVRIEVAPPTDAIASLTAQIADLEGKQMALIRGRGDDRILLKLSKMVLTKKMELSQLETEREEANPRNVANARLAALQAELDDVEAEAADTARKFEMRIAGLQSQISALSPPEKSTTATTKARLDEYDADEERLIHLVGDRRTEYKKMYGADPGMGIDGTAMGLVKVRPAREYP